MMSQGVAGHQFLVRATQLQDRFQIVVYGFRGGRYAKSSYH
jgi:hypothetical protein